MIYVGTREYKFRNMVMSHMIGDTVDELHKFANLIGVDNKWFQNKKDKPHYDICKSKKDLALLNGAILIDDREIILILKKTQDK